jgi:hypothetical protein
MQAKDKLKVIKLRDNDPFPAQLQDELLAVIDQDKYDDMQISQIVGVLEFLKWDLINRSD